ncbi:clarin-3 [Astyanax mexicanus]|uniref:clarin-3 n=1 Tax=Astyanax mexicanus TaxID=7994 RepID=UPI0020CAF487|nr:clarin-3 [Astyanax mexicanus]
MPSTTKMMYFFSSALLSAGGIAILGYGMSTAWADCVMYCGPSDNNQFNGFAEIVMGLFAGAERKTTCPRFDSEDTFTVFTRLEKTGGAAVALQGLVVCLLVLALLGSAGSLLITLYNTVSNPYETYMGPIGLFTCSGLSASLAFLALVLYLINVMVIKLGQELAKHTGDVVVEDKDMKFMTGFFLLLPYIILNLLTILLVYLYVHIDNTHRRQQEKPTEDAPKDIMMF